MCKFPLQKLWGCCTLRLKCPLPHLCDLISLYWPPSYGPRDMLPSSVHQASNLRLLKAFALAVPSGWNDSPTRASPRHDLLLHFIQLLFRCPLLRQGSPHPTPSPISGLITITAFSPCILSIIVHIILHFSHLFFLSPCQNTSSTKVGTFILFILCYIPNIEDCAW